MFNTDGKTMVLNVNMEPTNLEEEDSNSTPLERLSNAPQPSTAIINDGPIRSGSLPHSGIQIPQNFSFEWHNELLIILSMVLYVADIATDINVAYESFLIDELYKRYEENIAL